MMFKTSVIFEKNYSSTAKIVINQGGTSSGKTYSILQCLFLKCIEMAPELNNKVVTIVGQDIPNLKSGALRDAQNILNTSPELQKWVQSYNSTERIFTFVNGATMEFKSFDDGQDAKSGKRMFAFFNEANGISKSIFEEIYIRTEKQTFIDYNPNARFWVHDELVPLPESELIISDHRHNPFLSDETRMKIENLKNRDMELWRVYARGMTGKIEGLIFRNWFVVDAIPSHCELVAYGLDWGWNPDPTAMVGVYKGDGQLWVDQLLYTNEKLNTDLIAYLNEIGFDKTQQIIADSSEKKSIEEFRRSGFRIMGVSKPSGSIQYGIDVLKRYQINITKRSKQIIDEFNNYKWDERMGGKPVDKFNHGIDAIRYVAMTKLGITNKDNYHIL
jgi:phage terminase large subunit